MILLESLCFWKSFIGSLDFIYGRNAFLDMKNQVMGHSFILLLIILSIILFFELILNGVKIDLSYRSSHRHFDPIQRLFGVNPELMHNIYFDVSCLSFQKGWIMLNAKLLLDMTVCSLVPCSLPCLMVFSYRKQLFWQISIDWCMPI